ncbi:unnamed protein product [Pleuronectes platessa]|uniref:Uncharacterized protein n=1 Tax=Pleuronectes platessa TaxID=8262 RepID=A0A9N7YY03_PLEPL|nr:unnamed protein product [Pleuronectes platessa]
MEAKMAVDQRRKREEEEEWMWGQQEETEKNRQKKERWGFHKRVEPLSMVLNAQPAGLRCAAGSNRVRDSLWKQSLSRDKTTQLALTNQARCVSDMCLNADQARSGTGSHVDTRDV